MTTQVTWVQCTSGDVQVNPDLQGWGWSIPYGWGLHLKGKVQDSPGYEPWVHFHIPLPSARPEEQDAPRLQSVSLRFRTDCNNAREVERALADGSVISWHLDRGGAVVRNVHIYDGEFCVKEFNDLWWQSDSLDVSVVETRTLDPEVPIEFGLGVSVQVWFKNQSVEYTTSLPHGGGSYTFDKGHFGNPPEYPTHDEYGALLVSIGAKWSGR